ncbi:hypothetical protein A2U01_0109616, partial [Trifolium medium]|nr:hypothetical protein [Trifolium medium]
GQEEGFYSSTSRASEEEETHKRWEYQIWSWKFFQSTTTRTTTTSSHYLSIFFSSSTSKFAAME